MHLNDMLGTIFQDLLLCVTFECNHNPAQSHDIVVLAYHHPTREECYLRIYLCGAKFEKEGGIVDLMAGPVSPE
jgi:hypothetical protein